MISRLPQSTRPPCHGRNFLFNSVVFPATRGSFLVRTFLVRKEASSSTKEKVVTVNSNAVISYHFFFIRNEDVGDPKCSHLTSSEIGRSKNQNRKNCEIYRFTAVSEIFFFSKEKTGSQKWRGHVTGSLFSRLFDRRDENCRQVAKLLPTSLWALTLNIQTSTIQGQNDYAIRTIIMGSQPAKVNLPSSVFLELWFKTWTSAIFFTPLPLLQL